MVSECFEFFADSHAHFAGQNADDFFINCGNAKNGILAAACFCTNNIEENLQISKLAAQTEVCHKARHAPQSFNIPENIIISAYGIHPLDLQSQTSLQIAGNLENLQNIARNKQIRAVGEIGFDFRNARLRQFEELQCRYFEEQLAIAEKFSLPLVVHSVRGTQKLFEYAPKLQKLPGVIFHCWGGTYAESQYLLGKGVNAWFGFGNNLLQGKKSAIEAAQKLPLNRILPETDFPFAGSAKCRNAVSQIEAVKTVYEKLSELLQIEQFELAQNLYCNFCSAFSSSGISS